MTTAKRKFLNILYEVVHVYYFSFLYLFCKYKTEIEGALPGSPCIVVSNHFCADDFPVIVRVLKRQVYALATAAERRSAAGAGIGLNGAVWVDRFSKKDRLRAKRDLIEILDLGHDVLVYPEGAWNFSPNALILPIHWGVIDISNETGAPIVPVCMTFDGKICRVKIGDPYTPTSDKAESVRVLRDLMATQVWELLEKQPVRKRASFTDDYWETETAHRCMGYKRARSDPGAFIAYEKQAVYKPKGVTPPEEAFAHLAELKPGMNNAFLFNKRLI